ncbi:MAG: hypothetical protein HQL14_03570 [Candidatus Omnitrophica bacterium]|nr:hypothetical protein [Candidatus Omnitrophota bacterium]
MIKKSLGVVLFLFLFAGTLLAQDAMDQNNMPSQGEQVGQGGPDMEKQRSGPPRIPPQFAIDACTDKAQGDACEMTTPRGTRSGICHSTPDQKYFACMPNRRKMSSQEQQEGEEGPGMREQGQSEDQGAPKGE